MGSQWAQRYIWHLEQVPPLIAAMRGSVVKLAATRYDADRVGGSSDAARLPFRVEAMDDADELWSLLAIYAAEVVELIGGSSPAVLRGWSWSNGREIAGIPSGVREVDVLAASSQVTHWLCDRVETITVLPGLTDTESHLFGRVRALRQTYRVAGVSTRTHRRRCPSCGERGMTAAWATIGDREVSRVWCLICGATLEVGERAIA